MSNEQELFWFSVILFVVAVVGILWLQGQWSDSSPNGNREAQSESSSSDSAAETEALRLECDRLRQQLAQQRETLNQEFQQATFEQLQFLLKWLGKIYHIPLMTFLALLNLEVKTRS